MWEEDEMRRQQMGTAHTVSLDPYDIAFARLDGMTGVSFTKPSTIRTTMPVVGNVATFIVQTARQKEENDLSGNKKNQTPAEFWCFVEFTDKTRHDRFVIPPSVADVIARQRDALTGRTRVKAAKAAAKARKEKGIEPAFLKGKKAKTE